MRFPSSEREIKRGRRIEKRFGFPPGSFEGMTEVPVPFMPPDEQLRDRKQIYRGLVTNVRMPIFKRHGQFLAFSRLLAISHDRHRVAGVLYRGRILEVRKKFALYDPVSGLRLTWGNAKNVRHFIETCLPSAFKPVLASCFDKLGVLHDLPNVPLHEMGVSRVKWSALTNRAAVPFSNPAALCRLSHCPSEHPTADKRVSKQ